LEHWNVNGFGTWAAVLTRSARLIGYIGLSIPSWLPQVLPAVEVGWRLHPDCWGRGLATGRRTASLRHGFETLELDRIISIFTPYNRASRRVMEKLGMHDYLTTTDEVRGGTPARVGCCSSHRPPDWPRYGTAPYRQAVTP
jgi:RimJ/RimL family protein N-acetyltransferase